MTHFIRFTAVFSITICFGFAISSFASAEEALVSIEKPAVVDEAVQTQMFAAMEAGQIDVKFIPLGPEKANLLIKNLTEKPLNVQLPAAFAGVPVLAQFGGGMGGGGMGGGGMGGGGMGGMGGGGGQAMGGGGGGMGGGMGGMGGGGMGGFQRVAPQRTQKVTLVTVCLEHGKPDPTPKMAYKIIPLEQFTKDEKVHMVCQALGNGLVTQNSAQAAAWHLMDKKSWEELATMNKIESQYTGNVRWFNPIELKTAMMLVQEAERYAKSTESVGNSLAD